MKKGQANIITALVLIVLSLGAIFLVWNFAVKPILAKGGVDITLTTGCNDLGLEIVSCFVSEDNVDVTYKRGPKALSAGLSFSKMLIVYEKSDGTTNSTETTNVPGQLEAKNVETVEPDVVKVSIAGILTTTAGEDKTCAESSKITCRIIGELALKRELCEKANFVVNNVCYDDTLVQNPITGTFDLQKRRIEFEASNNAPDVDLYGFTLFLDYAGKSVEIQSLANSEVGSSETRTILSDFIEDAAGIEEVRIMPKIKTEKSIFTCESKEISIDASGIGEC